MSEELRKAAEKAAKELSSAQTLAERSGNDAHAQAFNDAKLELIEALAATEQSEPVFEVCKVDRRIGVISIYKGIHGSIDPSLKHGDKLYTSPPTRKLTDDEKEAIMSESLQKRVEDITERNRYLTMGSGGSSIYEMSNMSNELINDLFTALQEAEATVATLRAALDKEPIKDLGTIEFNDGLDDTSPPLSRLTDKEIVKIFTDDFTMSFDSVDAIDFANAIQDAMISKNGGKS